MPILTAKVQDTRLDVNPNFSGNSLSGQSESKSQKRRSSCKGKNEKRVKRKQEVHVDGAVGKAVEAEVAEGSKVEDAYRSVAMPTVDCHERFWSDVGGTSETMAVLVPSDRPYTLAEFPKMLTTQDQTWDSYCSATSAATASFLGNTVLSCQTSKASTCQTASVAFGTHGCRNGTENSLPPVELNSPFCHSEPSPVVYSGNGILADTGIQRLVNII